MNTQEADIKLTGVLEKQMAYKPSPMRKMAVAIIKAAVRSCPDGKIWNDNPMIKDAISELPIEDRRVVGTAWRWLGHVGILQKGQGRRRGTGEFSNGREIAEWELVNRRLAIVFLERNDKLGDPDQPELFAKKQLT